MMHSSKIARPVSEKKRAPDGGRFSHIYIIVSAIALAALINFVFIVNAVVPSGSMEPEIPAGQAVLGWRLAYITAEPQRGDIVIFHHEEFGNIKLLKRIVAVPGDTVEINSKGIWINDKLFTAYPPNIEYEEKSFIVPPDSYFLVGDNVFHSFDSREWENPFVSRKNIIAKVVLGYFPEFFIID